MANQIKSMLSRASDSFRKIEKKKRLLIAASVSVVIAAGVIGALLLNRVSYAVLYSGLSAEEAGAIKALLDERGVQAKVQGMDTICVPEEEADEIRIALAAEGYPSTGLNYDIFSNSSALGATDLERQTYLQYQLQENMRATIRRMNKISDCIVIVNLSNASSFVLSNNTTDASAAVMVSLEPGETLTNAEARSIGEFVAKCVPNLAYENISIVDSDINYYDILSDDGPGAAGKGEYTLTQYELTERMKAVFTDQAVSVLEPALGTKNLAVSVNVALNFDRETSSEVKFSSPLEDGEDGIVRSSDVLNELTGSGLEAGAAGEAGTDSNGVSAGEYVYGGEDDGLVSRRASETYNYEINEIRTDIEKAQGTVKDLSVSVLVNSNVEGVANYKDEIENLVANAIGVDPAYITVELMPFVQSSGEMGFSDYLAQSEQAMAAYHRSRLIRAGIIAGAIVVCAAIVLIARLFRKRKKARAEMAAVGSATAAAAGSAFKSDSPGADVEQMLDKLIMKKSDETEVIEELVEKYPETVVQVLRTWLAED